MNFNDIYEGPRDDNNLGVAADALRVDAVGVVAGGGAGRGRGEGVVGVAGAGRVVAGAGDGGHGGAGVAAVLVGAAGEGAEGGDEISDLALGDDQTVDDADGDTQQQDVHRAADRGVRRHPGPGRRGGRRTAQQRDARLRAFGPYSRATRSIV